VIAIVAERGDQYLLNAVWTFISSVTDEVTYLVDLYLIHVIAKGIHRS
jgi:hypothetical protein